MTKGQRYYRKLVEHGRCIKCKRDDLEIGDGHATCSRCLEDDELDAWRRTVRRRAAKLGITLLSLPASGGGAKP